MSWLSILVWDLVMGPVGKASFQSFLRFKLLLLCYKLSSCFLVQVPSNLLHDHIIPSLLKRICPQIWFILEINLVGVVVDSSGDLKWSIYPWHKFGFALGRKPLFAQMDPNLVSHFKDHFFAALVGMLSILLGFGLNVPSALLMDPLDCLCLMCFPSVLNLSLKGKGIKSKGEMGLNP
ncbi:unnamed protein product [Microthlaspi erraticum]|uniref:Uncharacterized protein n=1 Tax=Microthlaspi erraticum TaxID=1685480 RepID=A0A6D2IW15_9BRAS|nr:unnamed protein product [Microthlaspi erraticum]